MTERNASRSAIAEEWQGRATELYLNNDMFSAFVAGYIALVAISAQAWSDSKGEQQPGRNPDSHEFKKIQFAIGASANAIHTRLREAPTWFKVQELRDRPVPETAGARIMSAQGSQVLGRSLRDLAELWERHSPLSSPSIEEQKSEVNLVIELLRAARNRLFHGEKRFDPDGRDAELFSLLCPVLFAVSGPMLERLGGH